MKATERIIFAFIALLVAGSLIAATPIKSLIFQGDADAGGFQISNLGSPTNASNAATLGYVTNSIAEASTNYATSSQGILAASALQPGAAYTNISGLGNAATNAASAFATALQGANAAAHATNTANPHAVTKSQVGLGSVENTALSTWAGSTNITTLGDISLKAGTQIKNTSGTVVASISEDGIRIAGQGANDSFQLEFESTGTSGPLYGAIETNIIGSAHDIYWMPNIASQFIVYKILNTSDTLDTPAFAAKRASSDQTCAAFFATTTVVFNSVEFDNSSNYNSSTGVFTAPIAGLYSVNVSLKTSDNLAFQIKKNGTAISDVFQEVANPSIQKSTLLLKLAASDTISVSITTSTTAVTVVASYNTRFSVVKLSDKILK